MPIRMHPPGTAKEGGDKERYVGTSDAESKVRGGVYRAWGWENGNRKKNEKQTRKRMHPDREHLTSPPGAMFPMTAATGLEGRERWAQRGWGWRWGTGPFHLEREQRLRKEEKMKTQKRL